MSLEPIENVSDESISEKVATSEISLPENEDRGAEAPGRMGYISAYLVSLPLFGVGYVIDQTVRWTDHLTGLYNGLFHMAFFGMAWGVYMIPWILIVYFCYRKRETQARRTLWIIGPSVLVSLITLSGLVTNPPTPEGRFKQFAGSELPTDLRDLKTHFKGGGIYDYGDSYYFKTSSAEIERLITEMKLEKSDYFNPRSSVRRWYVEMPDIRKWDGPERYERWPDHSNWFYYLITDSAKTQAYIFVGCT